MYNAIPSTSATADYVDAYNKLMADESPVDRLQALKKNLLSVKSKKKENVGMNEGEGNILKILFLSNFTPVEMENVYFRKKRI